MNKLESLLCLYLLLGLSPCAQADDPTIPDKAGGQIEWARLKTSSHSWNRHARSDPNLLGYIRTSTNLNIDTAWHSADVRNLQQMTAYPFLFSEGIQYVNDPKDMDNLREYLLRGGFIFIDSCINTDINPNPDLFFQQQVLKLQQVLPDVRLEELPPDHEIFHCCFNLPEGLPHSYMHNTYDPQWAKYGLCAVYSSQRLVSIISLSGLQCGWDGMSHSARHTSNCMKMMVNIYVYAITH
jgi:hypothetical protein